MTIITLRSILILARFPVSTRALFYLSLALVYNTRGHKLYLQLIKNTLYFIIDIHKQVIAPKLVEGHRSSYDTQLGHHRPLHSNSYTHEQWSYSRLRVDQQAPRTLPLTAAIREYWDVSVVNYKQQSSFLQ